MTGQLQDGRVRRHGDAADGIVEINLDFPSLRHFQHEFSPYLSPDGLFVPTEFPDPPSTVVRFRVRLPDNFVLVQGTGVVLWTRTRESEPDSEPGMAVRFAALAPQSKDLIDRLVAAHVQRGGAAFGLDSAAKPDAPPAPAAPAPVRPRPKPEKPAPASPKPPAEGPMPHTGVFKIRGAEPTPPPAPAPTVVLEPEAPKQPPAAQAPVAPRPAVPAPPVLELAPELPPDAELEDLAPAPPAAKAAAPAPAKPPEQVGLDWEPPQPEGAGLAATLTQLPLAATPQPPPPGPEADGLEWESYPLEETPAAHPAVPVAEEEEPVIAGLDAEEDFPFVPDAELEPYEPVEEPEPEIPSPPAAPAAPAVMPTAPAAPAVTPATPAVPAVTPAVSPELPGYERGAGKVFDQERSSAGGPGQRKGAEGAPAVDSVEVPVPETEPMKVDLPSGGPRPPLSDDSLPPLEAAWNAAARADAQSQAAEPPGTATVPDAAPDDWLKVFEQSRAAAPRAPDAGPDRGAEPITRSPALDVGGLEPEAPEVRIPGFADREITAAAGRAARSSAARRAPGGRKSRLWVVLPVLAALAVIAATTVWLLPGLLGGSRPTATAKPTAAVKAPTRAAAPTAPAKAAAPTVAVTQAAQPTRLPEPSPTAAPAPTAVPVPSTPATAIRDITWAQQGDAVVVTLRGDGSLARDRVSVDLLSDPPRVLARLKGISKPYPQLEIPVGTAVVAKIRVGHHAEVSPPALYVVLDLGGDGLKVKSVEAAGGELRISVGR